MSVTRVFDALKYRWLRFWAGHLRAALLPLVSELYPRCLFAKVFWCTAPVNFGDMLVPWILVRNGIAPVYSSAEHSELAAIGSILTFLPPDYQGTILGSGMIAEQPWSLPNATILGVRGYLTAGLASMDKPAVLGDPGLLVSLHCPRPRPSCELGVIPHYIHKNHAKIAQLAARHSNVKVIDVQQSPDRVIRDIAACSAIITSSLHGLVVADSLGIPAAWMVLEPAVTGGDFKFLDHESVVSPTASRRYDLRGDETPAELIAQTSLANPKRVALAQAKLLGALDSLKSALSGEVHSPWFALIAWLRLSRRRHSVTNE